MPSGFGNYKACNTTGTQTDSGYPEHAFNWDVAIRVAAILRGQRITVIYTRPNDAGVGPCVDERAAVGNRVHATAEVAIHADGAAESAHGFHVIRAARDLGGQAVDGDSVRLSSALHIAMTTAGFTPSTYISDSRGAGYALRSDLAGLTLSARPSALIECGNMRNAGDAAVETTPAGRQRIASAIATGILAYLRG